MSIRQKSHSKIQSSLSPKTARCASSKTMKPAAQANKSNGYGETNLQLNNIRCNARISLWQQATRKFKKTNSQPASISTPTSRESDNKATSTSHSIFTRIYRKSPRTRSSKSKWDGLPKYNPTTLNAWPTGRKTIPITSSSTASIGSRKSASKSWIWSPGPILHSAHFRPTGWNAKRGRKCPTPSWAPPRWLYRGTTLPTRCPTALLQTLYHQCSIKWMKSMSNSSRSSSIAQG